MNPITKLIIPAAGLGTRFLPITKAIPKEMLPIGNKPALQYIIQEGIDAGIHNVNMIISPQLRYHPLSSNCVAFVAISCTDMILRKFY